MERSGMENWLTSLTGKYQQEDPQESSFWADLGWASFSHETANKLASVSHESNMSASASYDQLICSYLLNEPTLSQVLKLVVSFS